MQFAGLQQSIQGGGNNFDPTGIPVRNISGSAMLQYGAAALDLAQSDGDVTSVDLALSRVILPTTAIIAAGVIGILDRALANGEEGILRLFGKTKVRVNSTTDIAKGDPLKAANGSESLVKATGTDRYIAIALEARTDDDEGEIEALLLYPGGCPLS